MECYLKTGNCLNPLSLHNVATVNPTLFSLKDGGKEVKIGACPFDAYLPDTIEEMLSSDFATVVEDARLLTAKANSEKWFLICELKETAFVFTFILEISQNCVSRKKILRKNSK